MSDVFNADTNTTFNNGTVELVVNGSNKGSKNTNSQTLGQFVKSMAQYYGVRTFSVYVDGRKADTSESNAQIRATRIEIVAKDSRG